jgi:hypothetical protein
LGNGYSQGFSSVVNNPTRARIAAENTDETSVSVAGGAKSGASCCPSLSAWSDIRSMISDCRGLPPETRQSLIAQGDEAAGMAFRRACREIQQDHQAEE